MEKYKKSVNSVIHSLKNIKTMLLRSLISPKCSLEALEISRASSEHGQASENLKTFENSRKSIKSINKYLKSIKSVIHFSKSINTMQPDKPKMFTGGPWDLEGLQRTWSGKRKPENL